MSGDVRHGVRRVAGGEVLVCDDPASVRVASCDCALLGSLRRALAAENGELGIWWAPRELGAPARAHATLVYQRRRFAAGPVPPMLMASYCPFCGEPGVVPGQRPLSRMERAVLVLQEDPQAVGPALAVLRARGLLSEGGS